MKFIAHRGLISGPNSLHENTINQIKLALNKGYDVELDIHSILADLYLGHDAPKEKIDIQFIKEYSDYLWIHAKNVETLYKLLYMGPNWNIFYHEQDPVTLTTKKYIWSHPDNKIYSDKTVVLKFEYEPKIIGNLLYIYGLCSDFPSLYREEYLSL